MKWDSRRIKDFLSFCSGDTLTSQMLVENAEYPVYGGNGIRGTYTEYNRDGNFILVGRVGALCGNIHNVSGKFWATEHALIGTPQFSFNTSWLSYVLDNMNLGQHSVASAQPVLSISKISGLFLPFPPRKEQDAIANFLENECGRIGQEIELLERKADAYRRLRRSIINQAVTRGLNPNVKMVPSGNKWIGDIPEHWTIKRNKDLFFERDCVSDTGEEDLLSVSEYYGVAKRADKVDSENISRAESLVGYKKCFVGDIVMNIMLAWKGSQGRSDYNGIVSPAYGVYAPLGDINTRYFHYLFRSDRYKKIYYAFSKGIIESRLRLYAYIFFGLFSHVPPKEEQDAIVNFIDDKCNKIEAIESKIAEKIEKLKALKRSLINEVVTGQRAII